jgi:NAD-dependent deacetylase
MEDSLSAAAHLLQRARFVACLTGAGVSAESGIATFRETQTGLWARFDAQQLASQEGFAADPGLVWRWYMERLEQATTAKPNLGHVALSRLAWSLPDFTLITQNVDDLHERAGSDPVYHLHGSITRFRCNRCAVAHPLQEHERRARMPPSCHLCGDLVRPDVVWFGEGLPAATLNAAWLAAEQCDVMLVIGTSGAVYPAAQLPYVAKQSGAAIIDVNPTASLISEFADIFLQGESGSVVPGLHRSLTALPRNTDID